MKTIGIVSAYLIGAFFVVRAIVEVIMIDYGDSSFYEDDWSGPTLIGVLAVHCLPGAIALALRVWGARRLRRTTVTHVAD